MNVRLRRRSARCLSLDHNCGEVSAIIDSRAMFCPLCEKEYRDGFSTCSDCHVALVAALSEGDAKSAQLWKGTGQDRFDEILSRLDEAGIPRCYKEGLGLVPRVRLLSVAVRPVTNFEVRVLRTTLRRHKLLFRD